MPRSSRVARRLPIDYSAVGSDSLAWLDGLVDHETTAASISAGHIDGLSLEPMLRLMQALGEPQYTYSVIHITGTNGKGSVAHMIASLLQAMGLSVGLYTSPDFGEVNQRIMRNGVMIDDAELRETMAEVANAASNFHVHGSGSFGSGSTGSGSTGSGGTSVAGTEPSKFEALTAAALSWFSHHAVDVAVVEVGLLGRFDATNVVRADVAVITSLGKDHTDGMDGWQRRVIEEKAGIIEPTSTVVVGGVDPELRPVIEAEGPESILWRGDDFWVDTSRVAVGGRMIDLMTPYGPHRDVHLAAHGAFQDSNLAVAVMACEALLGRALPEDVVAEGLGSMQLPGRVEVLSHQPLVVVDSAHNGAAAAALCSTMSDDFTVVGSRILVVGMLQGKRPEEFLAPFADAAWDAVITTTLPGPRGLAARTISAAASALGLATESIDDPQQAIVRALATAAEEDLALISGSVRMVPIARAAVR